MSLHVLSDRVLRRLWASDAVSQTGNQVSLLALPLTAVAVLHASPPLVALLGAAATAPYLLLGLPAGVWVDGWDRRSVLVAADLLRAALFATVPIAWLLGFLTIGHMLAVALLAGACTVFFDVAFFAAVPQVVPAARLAEANAAFESTRAVAQVSGPGLGGMVVQLVSAPFAVALDALSFLASASLLAGTPSVRPSREASEPLARQMVTGMRWVGRHPVVRPLTLCSGITNLFHSAVLAMFVVFAVRTLGLPPAAVGVALALSNAGYLAGSLAAPRLNRALGVGRAVALGSFGHVGLLVLPLAPASRPWPLLVTGLLVSSAGTGLYNVGAVSLRQRATPADLLARMTATTRFVIWGCMPIGAGLSAVLVGILGLRGTLVVGGAGATLACLVLVRSRVWSLRDFADAEGLAVGGAAQVACAPTQQAG